MTVQTLNIQGTFDVAMARQTLRRVAQSYGWSPTFQARLSAVASAMAELGLYAQQVHRTEFKIEYTLVEGGIQFMCDIKTGGKTNSYVNYARKQLERAADELEVQPIDEGEHIKARVWNKK